MLAYVCVVVGLSFLFFYVLSFLFLCLKSFVRLWCGALWCGTHLLRATTCTVLVLVIENKKGNVGCVKLEDVVMTEPMPVSGGEPLATA